MSRFSVKLATTPAAATKVSQMFPPLVKNYSLSPPPWILSLWRQLHLHSCHHGCVLATAAMSQRFPLIQKISFPVKNYPPCEIYACNGSIAIAAATKGVTSVSWPWKTTPLEKTSPHCILCFWKQPPPPVFHMLPPLKSASPLWKFAVVADARSVCDS